MQQKPLLLPEMSGYLHVLQLPVFELGQFLEEKIDENPALTRTSFRQHSPLPEAEAKPSLFDHLMAQAREIFSESALQVAEEIIGNLDERGFFTGDVPSEEILKKIQAFDPPGIGAKTLQESLLIQLKLKGKERRLSYLIIENHFDDLLHNRLGLIQKAFDCPLSLIKEIIQEEIAPLALRPAWRFSKEVTPLITPDIFLKREEDEWKMEINDSCLPSFDVLDSNPEAKWLKKAVAKRSKTLLEISDFILKKQRAFFNDESHCLLEVTMQEAADALGYHVSTITRAVSHKYLCYCGSLLPLRQFFRQDNPSAKELLQKLIANEDKRLPLTDARLSEKLQMPRRTVTKYRQALKIETASLRRHW